MRIVNIIIGGLFPVLVLMSADVTAQVDPCNNCCDPSVYTVLSNDKRSIEYNLTPQDSPNCDFDLVDGK